MKRNWKESVLGLYLFASFFYLIAKAFDYLDSAIRRADHLNLEVVLAFGGMSVVLFLGYAVFSGWIRVSDDAKEHRNSEEMRRNKTEKN